MLQNEILNDLESRITKIIDWAESFHQVQNIKLTTKPSETGWSALECIDHLNRYSEFYLPVFNKAIDKARVKTSEDYKPGWLGNKMAEDMLPQNGKLKSTMKTFKSKNPVLDGVDPKALEKFIDQQKALKEILENSKGIDLSSLRVATTIPLLKLKLGDTLRFVVFHEIRHVEQAKRALKA